MLWGSLSLVNISLQWGAKPLFMGYKLSWAPINIWQSGRSTFVPTFCCLGPSGIFLPEWPILIPTIQNIKQREGTTPAIIDIKSLLPSLFLTHFSSGDSQVSEEGSGVPAEVYAGSRWRNIHRVCISQAWQVNIRYTSITIHHILIFPLDRHHPNIRYIIS